MSGLEIIGGISAVIAIIDGSVKVWNGARKDLKFGETFATVANRLPILRDTLQTCHDHLALIRTDLPADVVESLAKTVRECEGNAAKLHKIFEETIPGEDDNRYERYRMIARRLGKGSRVEDLVKSIAEATQCLVNYHTVKSARPELTDRLEKIVKDMQALRPSLSVDAAPSPQTVSIMSIMSSTQYNDASPAGETTKNHGGIANDPTINVDTFSDSVKAPSFNHGLNLSEAPVIPSSLFVGRSMELQKMEEILQPATSSQEHRRLVLGGMGGIGKTQLAIAYARQNYRSYTSVFWLNAASEIVLRQSLRAMGQQVLDIETYQGLDDDQISLRVMRWLSNTNNTSWLLIFDNYDEPSTYDIRKYCPYGANGHAIITTRLPDQVQGHHLPLRPLCDIEESLEILETRSIRAGVRSDPHARDLAKRMQGLPLALATAGAFLCKSTWSFERYLHEYEERWILSPRRPLKLSEYQSRSLYTTWDISYQFLEREDADAARLLRLMAYFDNQHIWFELFQNGISCTSPDWLVTVTSDSAEFEAAMSVLIEFCFVDVQLSTKSFSIHTCVHDWTLFNLNQTIDPCDYWYAFDCIGKSSIDKDEQHCVWALFAHLVPHAKRLTHHRFQDVGSKISTDRINQASCIANLLMNHSQYRAAILMQERALAGCEIALGMEHVSTLGVVDGLGRLYYICNKLAAAERMQERALFGRERALGHEHTMTLASVNHLARVYAGRKKLAKAEQMYRRAIAGYEKTLGTTHIQTLGVISGFGDFLTQQDRLVEAEQVCKRALAGHFREVGLQHPSSLFTVNCFGNLLRKQNRLEAAEQILLQSLTGFQKTFGTVHKATLQVLSDLASLYVEQENLEAAEKTYEQVLTGCMEACDDESSFTLTVAHDLAIIYLRRSKLVEGERLHARVLAEYEKTLGAESEPALDAIDTLGFLYLKQDKLVEAEREYTRLLARKEKALGPEHETTLKTVRNLGNCFLAQGKSRNAEEMYRRALAKHEKTLESKYLSDMQALHDRAIDYAVKGELFEAEWRYVVALVGYERTLGPKHESTRQVARGLYQLYRRQGRTEDAARMQERAAVQTSNENEGRSKLRVAE